MAIGQSICNLEDVFSAILFGPVARNGSIEAVQILQQQFVIGNHLQSRRNN